MEYFPLGLAEGKAFCNRLIEREKLLILIAHGQESHLTTKEMLMKLSTTSAAVVKAIKTLKSKDYIYETEASVYKIVDPLISSSISVFFPSDELI